LLRSHPPWRKASRAIGSIADQVRTGDQPQDREGARHRGALVPPAARRRGDRMKRREFIALLGGAAAWPLAARAQQPTGLRRVGVLMSYEERNPVAQALLAAFLEALAKLGWSEGPNIRFDYRWAATPMLLDQSAKELVALQPDVTFSSGSPSTASLRRETRAIPIVFANLVDPVGQGF